MECFKDILRNQQTPQTDRSKLSNFLPIYFRQALKSKPRHNGHLVISFLTVITENTFIKFDITVPPCKLYIENLTSKITRRPYNGAQMSIRY